MDRDLVRDEVCFLGPARGQTRLGAIAMWASDYEGPGLRGYPEDEENLHWGDGEEEPGEDELEVEFDPVVGDLEPNEDAGELREEEELRRVMSETDDDWG